MNTTRKRVNPNTVQSTFDRALNTESADVPWIGCPQPAVNDAFLLAQCCGDTIKKNLLRISESQ